MYLQRLRQAGADVRDNYSASDPLPLMPDDFDVKRFNRGRQFFQDNLFSCSQSMLMSLISGLSVNNLLKPLVFTQQSNTPIKALQRYMKTFDYVLLWHTGNVWDPYSDAHKSISNVRAMHSSVCSKMMADGRPYMEVSQYDMSLVQCGFMGAIVMYPDVTGIKYTMRDLSDYCYFWYGIGYLLGIQNENNICSGDLTESLNICKEIERYILHPALCDPPEQFRPMAKALVDGLNLPVPFPLFSLEAFLAISFTTMSAQYPDRLSLADRVRCLFIRSGFFVIRYVPFCRYLFNWFFPIGLYFWKTYKLKH